MMMVVTEWCVVQLGVYRKLSLLIVNEHSLVLLRRRGFYSHLVDVYDVFGVEDRFLLKC
jgi:hypothetical protein